MSKVKSYPLSLNGDTFNALKSDFDQMLRKLLTDMEKWESEEATIAVKVTVSLAQDQERDFEANGYDAMRDITKPTFKHEVTTAMQVKDKKSGSLGGSMKLVWDRDLCQYVMRDIDNGQRSLFDDAEPDEAPVPKALPALEDGNVIDADYEVIDEGADEEGDEGAEGAEDVSDGVPELPETNNDGAFEHLIKFAGKDLKVVEAMGNFTVRTAENTVILSSGFKPTDRFFASAEMLSQHVGHEVICISDAKQGHVSIYCLDCDEVLFRVDAPGSTPDDYEYEDPDERDEG